MTSWEEFIRSESVIEYPRSDESDRMIRAAISKLRKEGIVFISVKSRYFGFRKYIRIEQATDAQKNSYITQRLKAWETLYYNTILPIKAEIKDAQLHEVMGRIYEQG